MDKYFVVQDQKCPGTEFDSYGEARDYLVSMQKKNPMLWNDGRILGPNLYTDDPYDYPSLFD